MEPFVNFVIRPPRADYSIEDLLEPEFTVKGRKYRRKDVELRNTRGHILQCSHYIPQSLPEDTQLPCVIYCHGNSGCRADGNEAAVVLLPLNITVFTLDFSGSGLSDGEYVSLGWNEREDLKVVVSYLRSLKQTSYIGLWGRSMGAVTSLLYGAEDPSIAGMVLDSPFSNLFDLMMELVDVYKIRLPKFTIRVALQIMRRIIQKRAQFDIMDLNITQLASKTFIPALFGHASEDIFIPPHHSDLIHQEYAGDKNIIRFDGDHNSPRPQFYYDSVTIFFHNVLCPPALSRAQESCDTLSYGLDALQIHQDLLEHTVCEALSDSVFAKQETQDTEGLSLVSQKDALKESGPQPVAYCKLSGTEASSKDTLEHPIQVLELLRRVKYSGENSELSSLDPLSETRGREQCVDCYSYPSSNGASTKSWGRCSSQGISENSVEESPLRQNIHEPTTNIDEEEKMIMKAITASLDDAHAPDGEKVSRTQSFALVNSRRKCKFECLSRKFKLNCFRGMGRRSKKTA